MKKTIPLDVTPALAEAGVTSMTLTVMPAAERFTEKEAARERSYGDIEDGLRTGRYTVVDVEAMNPIDFSSVDWSRVKVTFPTAHGDDDWNWDKDWNWDDNWED